MNDEWLQKTISVCEESEQATPTVEIHRRTLLSHLKELSYLREEKSWAAVCQQMHEMNEDVARRSEGKVK